MTTLDCSYPSFLALITNINKDKQFFIYFSLPFRSQHIFIPNHSILLLPSSIITFHLLHLTMSDFHTNMQHPIIPTSTPSPTMPSVSAPEKSPYSPRTTINMNLRFLDRQSKKQAESEYDDEHGADPDYVASPGPEDSSAADQDPAHQKKRRKVRSAIVSRRKTAIYVEKLEGDLNERENENKELREKLNAFKEVMQDIKDAIEATQGGGCEPEPRTPIKRSRPSAPKFLPPVSATATDVTSAYAVPQNQYTSSYYAPTYPTTYNQPITSHLPPMHTTQQPQSHHQTTHITSQPIPHATASAFPPSYSQPQPSNPDGSFFLSPFSNGDIADVSPYGYGESLGNVLNMASQPQHPTFQVFAKAVEHDADVISDCSDRMVSPVLSVRTNPDFSGKRKLSTFLGYQGNKGSYES